jgi:hypothetical protein
MFDHAAGNHVQHAIGGDDHRIGVGYCCPEQQ